MSSTNITEQVHKNHSYTKVVYSQPSIEYPKIIHVIHHGYQNINEQTKIPTSFIMLPKLNEEG